MKAKLFAEADGQICLNLEVLESLSEATGASMVASSLLDQVGSRHLGVMIGNRPAIQELHAVAKHAAKSADPYLRHAGEQLTKGTTLLLERIADRTVTIDTKHVQ